MNTDTEINKNLSKKLRASYYFMGALLGKFKKVDMYFPGGCAIGARPINLHLKGFELLGATITEEENHFIIEAEQLKAEVPAFNVGDTVKVYGKIKEGNRERIQVFEGVVLKKQGGGARETFTVRKNSNGIGVEKTWPLHSPNVERVEVIRRGKVRRAKLNYLRGRVGKRAKVKELVK